MTGIILAGGKNSRFGRNKSLLKIGNETIVENIINKFKTIFDETLIVTNNPEPFHHLTRIVNDIIADKGSLGGLYSGLVNSRSEYNFVVACDMPFINVELVKFMKTNCNNFDVLIPKLKTGYETLHAIYSKKCIDTIEKQINGDNLKIIDFFPQVRVKEIPEDVIKRFDRQLLSFFNINTEDDYRHALKFYLRSELKPVSGNHAKSGSCPSAKDL